MGSHQSGEGFTAGEINWANNITLVIAARFDQGDFTGDFNGEVIVVVRPDVVPTQRPTHKVDGVHTYGYLGGSGVLGFGCFDDGPDGPAREAKPENIKDTVSAGTLSGIVLRNHDRPLRSAMRVLGDTCVGSIERGHSRSPYQASPLKRPGLVVVYSGSTQPQLQPRLYCCREGSFPFQASRMFNTSSMFNTYP
jgi:hypothetical protein